MNTTNSDLHLPAKPGQRRIDDTWPESMARGLFVAEIVARGLTHVAHDELQGALSTDRLGALGEPILVRTNRDGDYIEALLKTSSDAVALIEFDHGDLSFEIASRAREAADSAAAMMRKALIAESPPSGQVSVAFWMAGQRGGSVRHRQIEAPSFAAIETNYPMSVRDAIRRLAELRQPEVGRLILWRGEPGTGKSHALRALVRAWQPWCSAHFILDPEELFGRGGSYLLDLLTWDGDDEDRWRLVILEDAGELIASDARSLTGQGLSRLLNVADGLLGQGTHTLVLITTNEPVKRLHPATRRPGRCLADIEFPPLSVDEANAWLVDHGQDRRVDRPSTIAELYAGTEHTPETADGTGAPIRFGFARALIPTPVL